MRDLATSVREYYDQAADPVTADEVFRRQVLPPQPTPLRLRPAWIVALTAILVLVVVGGVGLLGLVRDDPEATDEPVSTSTVPPTTMARSDASTLIVPDLPVQIVASVTLTPEQHPIALYTVEPQDRAALIVCDDPSCGSFSETLVAQFVTFGHVSDVRLGADGLPVFVFSDFEDESFTTDAGLVHCSDDSCSDRSVTIFDFETEGMEPTMRLDPQGLPAAVFTDWDSDGQVGIYRLVRCHDATCAEHSVGTIEDAGGQPVLAFGSDGMPMLAFNRNIRDARVANLVLVTCSDATCSQGGTETVVIESPVNAHAIDMALADDDTPTFVIGAPKLLVVHCLDPLCIGGAEEAAISLDTEEARSIELGPSGLPVIAFTVSTPQFDRMLQVASCADVACTSGSIEVLATDSWMVSIDMTLTSSGNPVVAYQAGTSLGIVSCGDAACLGSSQQHLTWDQAQFQAPAEAISEASGWEQMESFAGGDSPKGTRAAATGAAGLIVAGTEDGKPTAWVSVDGESWSAHVIAPAGEVFAAVPVGAGFVVVGTTCTDMALNNSEIMPCDPAIWTSSDGGVTWLIASDTDQFGGCSSLTSPSEFGCQTWVDDITETDTGLLATGVDIIDGKEPNREVAWISADGITWQRISSPETSDRPPYPQLVAEALWSGGIYGLGTECSGDGSTMSCQPMGWISADGVAWEPVELSPEDFGASERAAFIEDGIHLVSGEFGLLALGQNIDPTTWEGTSMMFLSVDGERWTAFRLNPDMWGTNALVSLGDRVMAFGVNGVWVWTPDGGDF